MADVDFTNHDPSRESPLVHQSSPVAIDEYRCGTVLLLRHPPVGRYADANDRKTHEDVEGETRYNARCRRRDDRRARTRDDDYSDDDDSDDDDNDDDDDDE